MKPWTTIATARTPDGTEITLVHHDGDYVIRAGRETLMSSRAHGSEEAMATLACGLLQEGAPSSPPADPDSGQSKDGDIERQTPDGKAAAAETTAETVADMRVSPRPAGVARRPGTVDCRPEAVDRGPETGYRRRPPVNRGSSAHRSVRPLRVLVGGLGMGYTLRAALDALPTDATVVVAELLPEVVAWNEGPLGPFAGHPLRDPRVEVRVGDIRYLLHNARDAFDAILLDIDNGPAAFVSAHNASLYGNNGLSMLRAALRPGGVLALWSLTDDRRFVRRLRSFDFDVRVERIAPRAGQRGAKHLVFMAVRRNPSQPRQ
jgi:SAM-dependent methyltransferase